MLNFASIWFDCYQRKLVDSAKKLVRTAKLFVKMAATNKFFDGSEPRPLLVAHANIHSQCLSTFLRNKQNRCNSQRFTASGNFCILNKHSRQFHPPIHNSCDRINRSKQFHSHLIPNASIIHHSFPRSGDKMFMTVP